MRPLFEKQRQRSSGKEAMVFSLIAAAIGGICVGVLSGLLGVGGGIIIIPLLRLIFGADALMATGTSLFVILPTSIAGVFGRMRSKSLKSLNIKLSLIIGAGGILFSPVGSWLAELAGGPASMFATAIVIAYTGANMMRKALKKEDFSQNAHRDLSEKKTGYTLLTDSTQPIDSTQSTDHTQYANSTPQASKSSAGFDLKPRNMFTAIVIGIIAGFLSGFIGVGGGFVIVPMTTWLFGISFKEATGVSLLALCFLSIPGIITHGVYGHIDYLQGAMLAIGSIPGSLLGSALIKRVPEKALKITFGILLVAVAISLTLNELEVF